MKWLRKNVCQIVHLHCKIGYMDTRGHFNVIDGLAWLTLLNNCGHSSSLIYLWYGPLTLFSTVQTSFDEGENDWQSLYIYKWQTLLKNVLIKRNHMVTMKLVACTFFILFYYCKKNTKESKSTCRFLRTNVKSQLTIKWNKISNYDIAEIVSST